MLETDAPRFNPLKILRWNDQISAAMHGEYFWPVRANIDLTNLCNHACDWCEPVEFRKQTVIDKRHSLETDKATEAIGDLEELACRQIVFSGGGEPLLHDDFGKLLALAFDLNPFVVTNGTYIHKWRGSIAMAAKGIRVSLDAPDDATHMQVHHSKVGEFGSICDEVGWLGRQSKGPEVGLAYTVEKRNSSVDQMREFINLARSLGVDYVQVRLCSDPQWMPPYTDWQEIEKLLKDDKFTEGVRIYASDFRATGTRINRDFKKCAASRTVCVISANGDVSACCDERGITFGNLYQKRLREIWGSEEHKRKSAEIVPQFCERCVMAGYNEAVERFILNDEAKAAFV